MDPSIVTFNWKVCKKMPQLQTMICNPVTLNGKLYAAGRESETNGKLIVMEYTPKNDKWVKIQTPVSQFSLATLKDQLLLVGGLEKRGGKYKAVNKIHKFDKRSRQWKLQYPAMPTGLAFPSVIGYQDHLIVAGGNDSNADATLGVNILNYTTNKWNATKAEPLPCASGYNPVLIEDTMYLVGIDSKTLLRAHVPTLISGTKSGVWETLTSAPYFCSSPVVIGNTLVTVGGSKELWGPPTTCIQMYDSATNEWTKVGDLSESFDSPSCVVLDSKVFAVNYTSSSTALHVATLACRYCGILVNC